MFEHQNLLVGNERKRDSGVPIRKMPAGYNIVYEDNV